MTPADRARSMIDAARASGVEMVGAVVVLDAGQVVLTSISEIVRSRWGTPGPLIARLIELSDRGVLVVVLHGDAGADVWIDRDRGAS